MAFLSKLYFGCTIRLADQWPQGQPNISPTHSALEAFASEGIQIRSCCLESDRLRILIACQDIVAPSFLIQRLKGRLSFSWKQDHPGFPGFSRHFFVRSLGQNTKSIVSEYVRSQVDRSDLVDPLYRKRMQELRYRNEDEIFAVKTRHQGVYDLFAHVRSVGPYPLKVAEKRNATRGWVHRSSPPTAQASAWHKHDRRL